MAFSLAGHVTGVMGMPRRVYSAGFQGAPEAAAWQAWTTTSALGGALLFLSSLALVAVIVATLVGGRRIEPPPFELAEPLEPVGETRGLWDRLGVWTLVAVGLIAIAYGPPLAHLLSLERFGSLPFRPF